MSSMRLDGRDTTRDTPGHPITNQHTPRPVMLSKCQTLPKTNLARPPSISSARSNPAAAAHTRRIQTLRVVQERLRISRTNPFGVYDARRTPFCFLPSARSHTLCDLLGPTTQSAAYTATKGERREFLALEGKPANERPSFRLLTYL